jgi:hypothetical protein
MGGVGSGQGGAIFATNGVLNCIGCTFSMNTAAAGFLARYGTLGTAQGGAVCSYATLLVSQCSFLGNQTFGNGGGGGLELGAGGGNANGGAIFNGNSGQLSASSFVTNLAQGGPGANIEMIPHSGGIGGGGAVYSLGTLAATNCTFMANFAVGGAAGVSPPGLYTNIPGGAGMGGGLCLADGTATLVNLTFASNNAAGGAGAGGNPVGSALGGAICNSNATVNLYNTILAYSPSGSNCWGNVFDFGHNLSSDNSAGFYMIGSLNNTDPKLGPLGNFGGPTLTLPLLTGSLAIDGGDTTTAPPTDQRGRARPYGSAADIGAFESSPPFYIGGQVSGHTLKDEVTIIIGSSDLVTTNLGNYGASAFAAGTYAVTPSSPNYLFIPANISVTVGPDQLGVSFKAYHWNTLDLEAVTNGVMYCFIADTNGLTSRVLTSIDLVNWSPISTNLVGPNNYFEAFLPITGEPSRYYRTAIP